MKKDEKNNVFNQLAWIVNYQPKIEHQHFHYGNGIEEDKPEAEEYDEEEVCEIIEEEGEGDNTNYDHGFVIKGVKYSSQYTPDRCKRTFPAVSELFEKRPARDWVCFYHVLLLYRYMNFDSFIAFNQWLTAVSGKEIIRESNARKINTSYWAKVADKKWSLEGALKGNNSSQQENKFRDYLRLCEDIHDIIKRG